MENHNRKNIAEKKQTNFTAREKKSFFTVTEPTELMVFLIKSLPDQSRTSIKSFLAHKQVSVKNKIISQFNHPLEPGQQVVINWNKKMEDVPSRELKILFEDESIIVIEKHAGLLSVATEAEREETALSILCDHVQQVKPTNKVFAVHRLDRATSGVMMFAKSPIIQRELRDNWTEIVSDRIYSAIVEGMVEKNQDTIVSWLKENVEKTMYSSNKSEDGKKATTHYRVLKKNKDYSLLDVALETGRKNQIRVHMQDIGHSIVGDTKYGATTDPIKRLGLHAKVLEFIHPVTKKTLRFESPIPVKFTRLFKLEPEKKEPTKIKPTLVLKKKSI